MLLQLLIGQEHGAQLVRHMFPQQNRFSMVQQLIIQIMLIKHILMFRLLT